MRSRRGKLFLLIPATSLQILNTTTLVKSVKQTKTHFPNAFHHPRITTIFPFIQFPLVYTCICTLIYFLQTVDHTMHKVPYPAILFTILSWPFPPIFPNMNFNEYIIFFCGVDIINSWFSKLMEANYTGNEMAI